jgi:hypothetical protein
MLLDLHARPFSAPDRKVLSELDWAEVAALWNNNELGPLHDWLNQRWSRLIRDSVLGRRDPEAEFLQALAFATLALFFTQNHNQEGALLMLDDAEMALGKYRPAYLGIHIEPIYAALQELRPLLVGLAPHAECPVWPLMLPKFEFASASP